MSIDADRKAVSRITPDDGASWLLLCVCSGARASAQPHIEQQHSSLLPLIKLACQFPLRRKPAQHQHVSN